MRVIRTEFMNNEKLQHIISSWVPDLESELEFTEEGSQFLNITVQPKDLYALMSQLKNNTETAFDYLFCLTGMDWGEELGVVYHLESTTHRHTIVVKVQTKDRENPTFDSVCDGDDGFLGLGADLGVIGVGE